jgi:hypothetical protein
MNNGCISVFQYDESEGLYSYSKQIIGDSDASTSTPNLIWWSFLVNFDVISIYVLGLVVGYNKEFNSSYKS